MVRFIEECLDIPKGPLLNVIDTLVSLGADLEAQDKYQSSLKISQIPVPEIIEPWSHGVVTLFLYTSINIMISVRFYKIGTFPKRSKPLKYIFRGHYKLEILNYVFDVSECFGKVLFL